MIKEAAQKTSIPYVYGHSLRIGATLEYLKQGIPFEVVKRHGRWSGESFAIYLQQHAQIIGPYLSNIQTETFERLVNPQIN